MTADDLLNVARAAASEAYAPYSGFAVGAAILLADGSVVTGCNMENASLGLTLCAEAVALGAANAKGPLGDVRALAVAGGRIGKDGALIDTGPVYPCGRCRQLISEAADLAGVDLPVHCGSADGGGHIETSIGALLPHAFGPGSFRAD
jgi:cytidine deaminase